MPDDDLSAHDFNVEEDRGTITETDLIDLLIQYNHGRETLLMSHDKAIAWVVRDFRAAYIERTQQP